MSAWAFIRGIWDKQQNLVCWLKYECVIQFFIFQIFDDFVVSGAADKTVLVHNVRSVLALFLIYF